MATHSLAAAVLTAALVAGAIAFAHADSGGAAAADTARVASAATAEFRVVLTATRRRGGGGAPTAAVDVTTWRRVDGGWRRTATHRLRGPYFWHTVTGRRAVCRLEVVTAGGRRSTRPRTLVELLRTPSLGCGPAQAFALVPPS